MLQQQKEFSQSFQRVESIVLKMSTTPVSLYENITSDVFSHLIATSDPSYHLKILSTLLDTMKALQEEKKLKRAETFKPKIIMKVNNLVSILVQQQQ